MKMMLPDVIGHENQSQHYQHHRCLCLDLSGRITTPDRFSYHTGRGLVTPWWCIRLQWTRWHRLTSLHQQPGLEQPPAWRKTEEPEIQAFPGTRAGNNLGVFKKVFRFLAFLGF